MKSVTTYIHFNGNCREAMSFYQQCLGGELKLTTHPDGSGAPSADPNAPIMHAELSGGDGPALMASDSSPEGPVHAGNNFSVAIECDSIAEIDRLFSAIGAGGKVRLALGDMPWGARFGMLTDRFGIQWLLNCYAKS
jgi:PhnB protein